MSKAKLKMIIDTDCGVDDASAIILSLKGPLSALVDVLAITCVDGNTTVDNACLNVLQILEYCDKLDIPVHKGANLPLLGNQLSASHFHGVDGLGDISIPKPDKSLINPQHAVTALLKHVNENPGEVSLVCLGPLTNIALACRMDPTFSSKVKDIFIMGGNTHAVGNHTPAAEFNFLCDPESAYITMHEMKCPIVIVPWEFCIDKKHMAAWEFFDKYISTGSKISNFMCQVMSNVYTKLKSVDPAFVTADPFPMVVALCPDIVTKQEKHYVSVECHGVLTRGQMVVDNINWFKKEYNASVIVDIDMERFCNFLLGSVS